MKNNFFCSYHLILNSSKDEAIKVILQRLNKQTKIFGEPATTQPYHKEPEKTEVFGYIELPEVEFDSAITLICRSLQHVFHGWSISGDFENEIMMSSEKCRESGVRFISLTISRWGV